MREFVFIPHGVDSSRRSSDFPRVSASEQSARDVTAEQLVADEFDQAMPEQNRAALETEYQQRFGKSAPGWEFTPLSKAAPDDGGYRFVPLDGDKPSVLKTVALNNPATAAVETGAHLATMGVALPVSGLAGLATEAARAVGLTETNGADVVRAVGGALTYMPRGEMGQAATDLVTKPLQWLDEKGQEAGNTTLETTGSPAAATAVYTAINMLPMAIAPGVRAGKAGVAKARDKFNAAETPKAPAPEAAGEFKFTPIEEVANEKGIARTAGVVDHQDALPQSSGQGLEVLRGSGDNSLSAMGGELPAVSLRRRPEAEPEALAHADQRGDGVLPGERGMVAAESATAPDAQRLVDQRDGQIAADERRSRPGGAGEDVPLQAPRESSGTTLSTGADGSAQPRSARYALVEAKDLKPQDRYAQPDWYAREKVTQEIVGEFEPNRLIEAMDDAGGAPIVLRDGTVEVGHKRAEALQRIYQANGLRAENYRQHLRDSAASLGLDPAAIDQMKKPVLVRVPDESAPPRAASADFSNTRESGISIDAPAVQDMAAGVQNGTWNPGQNYTPFVDHMRAPEAKAASVADLPAPKRREKIIRELADALDTHVYQGRVKGKNRLGFFRPANREVRIKNAADIEVASHELAHLLDNKIHSLSAAWRSDKALREELKSVSYDQKSVKEGFAEAVRLWATQADTLEAKAPRVFKWLEDFANSHEYGPPLRLAQSRMHAWYAQDALNRARSKIGDPDKLGNNPIMQHLGDWWKQQRKEWRQSVSDDLAGLYDAERSLTGKISPTGAYETARLSRGAPAITDGAIRFGAPLRKEDGSYTFTGKGLHEILRPVSGRIEDFMLYAVGRSAQELMGQKREHLFSSAEIEAMVNLETPEFRKALNEFQTWNRAIVDYAQAHGVVNAESRAMWNRQIYLPFWRVSQPGEWKGGKVGDWQGVKALTGGTSNIRDVLSNVIGNANLLITKARVNDARARTVKLITENKGGHYLTEIPKESRPVKIAGEQVAEAMLKRYGIAINEPGYFEFMLTNQAPAGSNIIAVLENGKPRYFEVGDPLLFRSLAALERPPQHWLVQWLGLPRRVGQASITLDPTFIARNLARDQVMAGVMSRAGFRPMIDAMDGVYSRIVGDETYQSWIAHGGGLSSLFLDDAALKKNLDRFYAGHGINAKTVLDTPAKMLYFVERAGEAVESATRVGEFKRAIERGEDPRHAAYLSREVSVDWATKGDSKALGVALETMMFLRAAVVSLDRVYRGVAHDPNRGAIAVKTGAIALASTMLYLMNRGDSRYDDMEDWKKDAFWHVWVGDEHFMVPKAFEVGAVASIAERTTEKLLDADPTGLGKDYVRIVGNVFGLNWKPQIIAPIYDQATNKQGLTRTPIETPGMQDLQPAFRAKPYTSETMKKLGQMTGDQREELQFNPVRAEALLRGYLNAWGGYALMATDALISDGKAPAMRTDQLPVVKVFYANEPPTRTKFENQFFEMLGQAKRLRGTLRELDDLGLRTYADAKEQGPLAGEAKPLERAAKNLSGINRDMEAVRRDGNLAPAEKRAKLDGLTVERNALLKAAVQDSKAAQKAKVLTPADIAKKGLPR